MTTAARDHDDDRPRASYELPPRLTPWGRTAFTKAVDDFAAELATAMDRGTRFAAEFTDRDVDAALTALGRGPAPQAPPRSGPDGRTAAALVTAGSVGASLSAPFLHSPLQVAVFVVLVAVGLAGLALTWVAARA